MGERKVLNKYYPPDFDPSKISRTKKRNNQKKNLSNMLPMTLRCNTCSSFIYKGTKSNSRQEVVVNETYLGIPIYRFYLKCTNCKAEITFKTDPQNSDYTVENGSKRNFEPWRSENPEAEGVAIKSLESKSVDNKKEMDCDANLHELMSMKSRHETISSDTMLVALQHNSEMKQKELEQEEDEALIKSIFQQKLRRKDEVIRRLSDDDEEELNQDNKTKRRKVSNEVTIPSKSTDSLREKTNALDTSSGFRISAIRKKVANTSDSLLCIGQNYENDTDDD